MGFAACQQYLGGTAGGMAKGKETFDTGPVAANGIPLVQIENAAANHWKHRGEQAGLRRLLSISAHRAASGECRLRLPSSALLLERFAAETFQRNCSLSC